MSAGFRYRPEERLHKPSEYQRAFDQGRVVRSGGLTVRVVANGLDQHRLGLVIGRRYGGAVRRNRLRRLVREAFRLGKGAWPSPDRGRGLDLVVLPAGGGEPILAGVQRSLAEAVARGPRAPATKPGPAK